MQALRDDVGTDVKLSRAPRRVVSLVPSLTESIALSSSQLLVGATDWCTHPADLEMTRVRGTKNPDVDLVTELAPDLVVANAEENRAADIDALRRLGNTVWVTAPESVPAALDSLRRLLAALDLGEPSWLRTAKQHWQNAVPPVRAHAIVPIWRRPWMALGRDTFAGDLLRRLGVRNVLADHPDRYPRFDLDQLPDHDLVVLPDEPYAFSRTDGPEAFPGTSWACVSGRHLTWYGPSLAEARDVLMAQLAAATR
ncbi:MAG: helical backbone metal receptor [Nocardioidaceae bacterium]